MTKRMPIPERSLKVIRARLTNKLPDVEAGLLLMCLETGCRCSEAVNLMTKDIDYSKRTIQIRSLKGGNIRPSIKVSAELIMWLKRFRKQEFVADRRGESFKRSLRRYFSRITNGRYHIHQMRHSFVHRALAASGNDIIKTARVTGHKNVNNVMEYANDIDGQDLADLLGAK